MTVRRKLVTPMSTPTPTPTDRPSRRAFLFASGGLILTPALLAACGGDDTPSTGASPSEDVPGSGAAGGTLTLGVPVPFGNFDPYDHLTTNFVALRTFYDYLVTYDENLKPQPALAETWEIADDNTEVVINLREAVFHSGKPVTAADLVAGIERAKNPDIGSNQHGVASFIDTANADDERTLRVTFTGPTPEGQVTDWMNWFPIVEASSNDPEKLTAKPAGSGPFRFESYSQGTSLVMTKNPDYWDDELPLLDEVRINFFDDEDSLVAALESGDVDAAAYLASRYIERLQSRFTTVEGASDALVELFYMNPNMPPFDNPDVRQAIARAINRERIIEQVRFGVSAPVYNGFGPSSPAYDESYLQTYGYDLDAAKELLDKAGGTGLRATAAVQPAPGVRESMQIIQADLASIGFELEIEPMEQTTFVTELRAGNVQACISATSNTYRSPGNIAQGVLAATPDNPFWKDKIPQDYIDAVEAAKKAVTEEDQKAAYAAINESFAANAWAIGVATRPSLHALAENVGGFARDEGDHIVLTETTVS